MRSTTDLEALIRRLAGRDLPGGGTPTVDPDVPTSTGQEVELLQEIRRRTRVLFDEPGPVAAPGSTDDPPEVPIPTQRGARSARNLVILGLAVMVLLGSTNALVGWLADRLAAARGREQTALLIAELRREDARRVPPAIPDRAQGRALDPQTTESERRLQADLAAITAKLTALALDGSGPPPGGLADPATRPPKRSNSVPPQVGADPDSNLPPLGVDLAAIRRELASSEAATMRQLQEMRTVLHELNTVVRRVLSRPNPPDHSNVTLPLLAVAVQALINNLQHQTTQVRGEAVEQLIRLGPLARSALPALRQMQTRETDPNVRSAVETAINVISSN